MVDNSGMVALRVVSVGGCGPIGWNCFSPMQARQARRL